MDGASARSKRPLPISKVSGMSPTDARPLPPSPGSKLGRAPRSAARLEGWGAVLGIALVVAALFGQLLREPERFPTAARCGAAENLPLVDALVQDRDFRETGAMAFFDRSLEGRNRLARGPALLTHPLVFLFSRFLPLGASLSLVLAAHVLAGALGAYFLARRLGLGGTASLAAAWISVISGRLLDCALLPWEQGLAMAAALLAPLVWLSWRLIEAPRIERAASVGAALGALACAADLAGIALALALWLISVPFLCLAAGPGFHARRALVALAFAAVWGLALGAYRLLPPLLGGEAGDVFAAALAGPWWRGLEVVRLPFHLGAVPLFLFGLALRRARSDPSAKALLALAALALALAALGPEASLAFLGLPVALVGASALRRGRWLASPRLAAGIACAVAALALVESWPARDARLAGRSLEEIAAAPRWLDFAATYSDGAPVAFEGAEREVLGDAKAYRGIVERIVERVVDADIDGDIDGEAAGPPLPAYFLVRDLPSTNPRLRLLQACRQDGKYIYQNLAWRGEETFAASRDSGAPARGRILAREIAGDRLALAVEAPEACQLLIPRGAPAGARWEIDGRVPGWLRVEDGRLHVPLSAGAHRLEMTYRPPGLALGAALSAIALALAPIVVSMPWIRRRIERRDYRRWLRPRRRRERRGIMARRPSAVLAPPPFPEAGAPAAAGPAGSAAPELSAGIGA
jgi:hypothetical protein